ncbi:MAG: SusC/RagA family TonB-linked outer membrane protein [Ginsengibacter sp.]
MRKFLMVFSMLMLSGVLAFAQTHTVSGTVKDDTGAPVPFATVIENGTKNATTADGNGSFTIKMRGNGKLSFSATGFSSGSATPEGNSVTISLKRNTSELTAVVITTALGVQRQAKELGYAQTTISNKTLTQAKSVNVAQALNGKVSGLNISTVNSGVFENAKINIRGIRSLTGNNQPMLVVDGAPTPLGYLSSIPPDDVQDLTVLKSAASAAIYGPDAVNGVIIITTKRGGRKPTITLNSTVQATKVSFFPKFQTSFGDGAGETADQYGNYTYVPYENQQYGPMFDGSIQPIGPVLEDGSQQSGPYNNKHYQDKIKFFNTGLTLQNSVSIAGEDFYMSVEDAKINGLVPKDENHRTSFRFNGGKKYGNFSVNYGLNYILQNSDVVNEAGFQTTFPGAYDGGLFLLVEQVANNVPLLDYKDQNSKYGQFSNYFNEFAVNPYWLIDNIRQKTRQDDILGNIQLDYQLVPWLKASARLSTNLSFIGQTNTNAPVVVSDWAAAHRSATQYSPKLGNVLTEQGYTSRINLDYYLSGDHKIVNDFSFRYLIGGSLRDNRSRDVAVGGNNLVVPGLYNVAVKSGDANVPLYIGGSQPGISGLSPTNNFFVESRLLSAYGTVGFSYKRWANVEFTGRNDWDSRLLKENRSFFYPAANVSIVLSDAIPALQSSNIFSYVKVRGAISKSGNVNLNPYSLQATYSQPAGFPYGSTVGFTANATIPSSNLKPEFVNTKEVGLELGFLKNRINFEGTYYYQNNTNQILLVSQSSTTGYTSGLANAAAFKNYGVELDLGLTPLIRVGKGRIDLKVNATYNNNKVTSTLGNVPVIIGGTSGFIQNAANSPTVNNIAVVGLPAFAFQMTDYLRDSATGKVVVDPVNGNPTQAQGTIIRGRTLPLWIVGLTPSFSVGSFSVSMTWEYKGGNDFYSGMGGDEDFAGISSATADYGRKRFVFPNSVYKDASGKYVPNTNIQVQDGNYNYFNGVNTRVGIATNYYASAAAWRCREVNITYNLPARLFEKGKFIKKVSISAVGKNLFLIVPKSNLWGDPEFNYAATGNTFGIASGFQSPASRLFGGSVTVQF